jgi:hypothetical protein
MSRFPSKGQALPEYVLTAAVLILVAIAGLKAWRHGLAQAEARQARTYSLPSP